MNFTALDILSATAAILLFPLFVFVPGYVLGWVLNLASFRHRTPLLRLLLSLPLSIALTPAPAYLLGRFFSVAAVWVFYGVLWLAFLWMLRPGNAAHPSAGKFPAGAAKPVAIICAAWMFIAVMSLVDLEIGHKLYFTAVSYDYQVRSGAISGIARANWYPPQNPFFYPGHPAPFRYHYFWFLLASLPDRLARHIAGPRHILIASVFWIGMALMATMALYQRFFHPEGASRIRRRTLFAFVFLTVTGLDILPTLFSVFSHVRLHWGNIYASIDWWNADQVTGWLDSTLWVPHHLSSLLACMIGFLVLWDGRPEAGGRPRWQSILAAGVAFASASGLSIYVTFVFAGCLGAWCLTLVYRKRFPQLIELATAGAVAVALGAPFLLDLAGAGTASKTGGSLLKFGIRTFQPTHMVLQLAKHATPRWIHIGDFLTLPLNFLFEMGVLFIVLWIQAIRWARSRRTWTDADLASAVMLIAAAFICTFVRSNVIENNDLGMRGMLIVQFLAVLWGAGILLDWRSRAASAALPKYAGVALTATLVVGLAGNLYELFMLRSFTILTDNGMNPGFNNINPGEEQGARTYAARDVWEWLSAHTPDWIIEQHNPVASGDLAPGLYSNRQMVMLDGSAAIAFGGNPAESKPIQAELFTLFGPESRGINVDGLCQSLGIHYLVARAGDPVWRDPQSWVWMRKPVYANGFARAFSCGTQPQASPGE